MQVQTVFNVADYGAIGVGDETSKIQRAIDAARAVNAGPAYSTLRRSGKVYFPHAGYQVSSLDGTLATGLQLIGNAQWGVTLYGNKQTTSKPILDLTGSANCCVQGIDLQGANTDGTAPSVLPSCGLLISDVSGGVSNRHLFERVSGGGHFVFSMLYMYASTDNGFKFCAFSTGRNGVPAAIIDGTNNAGITSPYQTIITGAVNTGETSFWQTEFHDQAVASGASTVKTVQLRSTYSLRFKGGPHSGSGPAHFEILGTCRNLWVGGMQFYSDNDTAAENIFLLNGSTLYGVTLDQCAYSSPGTATIFRSTPNPSTIRGAWLKGYPGADGWAGNIALMDGASILQECVLACSGRPVNVSASGSILRGLLINPGTITAGTNTSTSV